MPFPPLPENLRFAKLSDLTRIGIVSTAAFFNSPVFHYFRPEYKDHLQDTVASYRASCAKEILDPETVVIVAEDTLKENESDSVFTELRLAYPPLNEQVPASTSETRRVIVGVASLSLTAVPALSGQFLPDDKNPEKHCNDPEDLGRDKYSEAFKLSFVTEEQRAKEKWKFCEKMEIASIAVHPAYWRQGNGKRMAQWFIALAERHDRAICVSAAPMGKMLASHLEFQECAVVTIDGYEKYPEAIRLWFGLRSKAEQARRSKPQSAFGVCHLVAKQPNRPDSLEAPGGCIAAQGIELIA